MAEVVRREPFPLEPGSYERLFQGILGLKMKVIGLAKPAGPMPRVESKDAPPATAKPSTRSAQPRTTILGPWKLNRDESDDWRKRSQEERGSNRGGYRGKRGGMGGGRGGYGDRAAACRTQLPHR